MKQMNYKPFAGKYSKVKFDGNIRSPISDGYSPRETPKIRSLGTITGSTSLKEKKEYTGTNMIGISIVHKSCLQPIFNEDEAKAVASMRR